MKVLDIYVLKSSELVKEKSKRISICLPSKEHYNLRKYSNKLNENNLIELYKFTNIDPEIINKINNLNH
jgi:hypothetical protein